MTLDELIAREAIRDTLARVAQAGDALDFDGYVACFAEDGALAFGEMRSEGRAAIRAQMERNGAARFANGVTFVRHNPLSTVIRLAAADRAEVRSYFMVFAHDGPDHFGGYDDMFGRYGTDWLIRERRVRVDWVSPNSRHSRKG